MVGERLRRFRIARGMSLGDLEAAIDGLVSSRALSNFDLILYVDPKSRPQRQYWRNSNV